MKVPQPIPHTTPSNTPASSGTGSATTATATATTTVKNLNLQPGQLLNIKVINLQGNRLTFTLPNQAPHVSSSQTFQAETQSPVKPGQQYTVKVIATHPKLQLQLQTPAQTTNTQATATSQLYRQLLPNMQPLAQALQQLSQPGLLKQLPVSLQQQIQKLLDTLLKPQKNLSGKQLKQATEISGLFFENRLSQAAQGKASPQQQDLKAQLLKLQSALQAAPSEPGLEKTKSLIDKMLNRITLNQIQSLENPWWITDLPMTPTPYFKQISLQVRAHPEADPQSWHLTLNLETEEGLWQNLLHFNAHNELWLTLWVESPSLRGEIASQEATLKQQLEAAGIQLKQLNYLQAPPETEKQPLPNLIDITL